MKENRYFNFIIYCGVVHYILGSWVKGLVEDRGTVGIRPNQILAATLTLFQPEEAGRIYPPYKDVPTNF